MARIDIDDERWEPGWTTVCAMHDLFAERMVSTVVDGERVVVLCAPDGTLHALRDATVGGLRAVSDRDGVPVAASHEGSNVFDLRTGRSLADPRVRVPVYAVRLRLGMVEIAVHPPVMDAEAG